jgi:ribonuclease HIII
VSGAREDGARNDDTTATENGESCWRFVAISKQSRTSNAQRRTSNAEFGVGRSAFNVERFCFIEMNSYTHALTNEQATKLRALLDELGFEFSPKEYTIFFGQKNKLSVAVYEKGPKVLVQGKGVEEFVQFELEPKILGEARLGYEEVHSPEMFRPHFGIDESGKGDFFGPLVIAGVYVDAGIARRLIDEGVQDSKRIGSDARIRALAGSIRKNTNGLNNIVLIGPEKYNELYQSFGNLNSLLGWGHARVIENLLAKKPDCPRSLSDQFADARVIERSLLGHGQKIQIEQRPRAESDVAVAAASILAREGFIDWLERRSKKLGLRLGRGVSASVKEAARKLVEANGPEALREVAKVHFRTAHEIAPDAYAAPPPRRAWRK